MVFKASVQGKEIAGKIVVVAKVRHWQRIYDPLLNIWIIAEKGPSQLSSWKIFWKLLTVKQQTGSLSFIGTIKLLKSVERLCLPCKETFLKTTINISIDGSPVYKRTLSSVSKKSLFGAWCLHVWNMPSNSMVWHSAYFSVSGSISSPSVTAMAARSEEKAHSLIPFVSISLFRCRSNWLTKVDLSKRNAFYAGLRRLNMLESDSFQINQGYQLTEISLLHTENLF